MEEPSSDAGTIQVLLKRLNDERLPRTLSLNDKVDRGEQLNEYDIRYLSDVLEDAHQVLALADRHPEYQSLVSRLIGLYGEITRKALANEPENRQR